MLCRRRQAEHLCLQTGGGHRIPRLRKVPEGSERSRVLQCAGTHQKTITKEGDTQRDPRNDHLSSIARATEYLERGGRDLAPWIPFDATDWDLPAPSSEEVRARQEGMVSLKVNYRSAGGLLEVMNEWWEDLFSDRHRILSKADFYASSQTLHSFPDKKDAPASIEWICPPDSDDLSDPQPI